MQIKEKILCLGDNTSAEAWAHHLTENFSKKNNLTFRGLIKDLNTTIDFGCYHTNLFNLSEKDIIELSKKFDRIIILNQYQEQYSHPILFVKMYKLIKNFKELKINIEIENKDNFKNIEYWYDLLKNNKSFCIYPWIYSGGYYGYHTTCMISKNPITKLNGIKNWQTNSEFLKIRNKMLNGEKIEKNCRACYDMEEKKISDLREDVSIKWAISLNLKSVEDLKNISDPAYYEIRPSNKCNIKCRTCEPSYSHLIEKEYVNIEDKEFKKLAPPKRWSKMTDFDTIKFDSLKRLYVSGGEPTILPELYNFLRKCIKEKKTDFDFRINTNAVKISNQLFDLFKKFPNLGFSCSIDGIPKINEYIRWGTDSKIQIKNIHNLHQQGHQIAFISVVSIYNIATLGELMNFFDEEFPYAVVQLQTAGGIPNDLLSGLNHPNSKIVLKSLELAKKTKCYYHAERGTKIIVDTYHEYYSKNHCVDLKKLKNFFIFNDQLDISRNSRLIDYIPDLENCRNFIKNNRDIEEII